MPIREVGCDLFAVGETCRTHARLLFASQKGIARLTVRQKRRIRISSGKGKDIRGVSGDNRLVAHASCDNVAIPERATRPRGHVRRRSALQWVREKPHGRRAGIGQMLRRRQSIGCAPLPGDICRVPRLRNEDGNAAAGGRGMLLPDAGVLFRGTTRPPGRGGRTRRRHPSFAASDQAADCSPALRSMRALARMANWLTSGLEI